MSSFSSILMFLQLELRNILAKAFTGSLKIDKREKHANDEKSQLLESLPCFHQSQRRITNSSKDGSELEVCGNVNGVEELHSRIGINHFPSSCGEKTRTSEMTARAASWWASFAFSLCMMSLKYSKPVLQAQPPHPLWLSIISMLSFTLFASAATVMLLVGARFTHMQIIVMLIAFFALVLA